MIPAGAPVHRELSGQADASTRMAWAKTVFSDMPKVQIKDWEIGSSKPVAAIDTLKQFRQLHPETMPLWLCGADSFASMESWVDYPEHQQQCNVAVFSRIGEPAIALLPGWKPITVENWKNQKGKIDAGHLIALDGSLPEVSATVIRDMALRGESLSGLINSRICNEVEALYGPISGEML